MQKSFYCGHLLMRVMQYWQRNILQLLVKRFVHCVQNCSISVACNVLRTKGLQIAKDVTFDNA